MRYAIYQAYDEEVQYILQDCVGRIRAFTPRICVLKTVCILAMLMKPNCHAWRPKAAKPLGFCHYVSLARDSSN